MTRPSLVAPRPQEWARRAIERTTAIHRVLPDVPIEHIGSTAVPDLPAKDCIDLLVGVDAAAIVASTDALAAVGWDVEGALAHHAWLSWPHRSERSCVVHVVEDGGRAWRRPIAFRDLLRADADARRRYLDVKRAAAATSQGWDDYTARKTVIVAELLIRDG
ncbi:GrpB family protein [Litorihabitans aurantiacus]|uniref:UPF0157 protein n=1 Tax=Litorihabitans aurantiacus TaxID=1930061 RepID=A0AA37XGI5_9MICO|nr:GrpB family protein [Litorihabitans aurantiacus]GMA32985.1 UPF0157 protein [Litorihabitans aurantiacus]